MGNHYKLKEETFRLDVMGKFFIERSEVLEQAAQNLWISHPWGY